jgi:cyanophycin synthetase
MRIVDICNYPSRNIYSHKPVVKMIIDLEELYDTPTKEIGNFNERLLDYFPGLKTHFCSPGYEGGFIERLKEGTLVSHVIEHLALELQCMMGYEVYFGKTRIYQEPSTYYIIYEYINEYCAREFGYSAEEIVSFLLRNESLSVDKSLQRLYRLTEESELGPSTKAIFAEAREHNIPVRRLGEGSLLQLGYGKQMRFIEASLPDRTSCIAVDLAKNKCLAKKLLREHLIPVPEGDIARSEDDAVALAKRIGYPVVVKPLDANQGKGVSANLKDEKAVRAAYCLASYYGEEILIEKYVQGRDYRLLVVGDQVAAAAERKPPSVEGDGVHSIAELVDMENQNTNRGVGHSKPLTRISLDSISEDYLYRSGLEIDDIPSCGEHICLRENGNLSTGGSARDCTAEIHPLNAALAVKAAKAIGLDVAGIDVVMDDISKPLTSDNGGIIEINAAPGLRMHLYPMEGKGQNVAAHIIDLMYPAGEPSSIPIISITGTNGKTTVTRMISHVLSLTGQTIGMTCSSGTFINHECISQGDNTGAGSARLLLYNREVEAAVLETARGGIIRSGLGYDLADVGIITNITEDHFGQDGINSLEDMAFVKSLVVEAVKLSGYAVLNADDPMTEYILPQIRCNIILFARSRENKLLENHLANDGMAIVAEYELIYIYKGYIKNELMRIDAIPVTFAGKAVCNIENSLAAMAGLLGLGIPEQIIQLGIMSFQPDATANTGRLNLFDMGDFQVLIDYGHNQSGYQSVIAFASALEVGRLVGIIGMPGDRLDQAIMDVGRIAGQAFSRIYIKEDQDLRGRNIGEVADLLYSGALSAGAKPENIKTILSETDALREAMDTALPGDLIVLFYEHFEPAFSLVQEYLTKVEEVPVSLYPISEVYRPIHPYVPQVLH